MKITKRQLRQIIREAIGKDFFSDREANPHDGSMYGEPEGGWQPKTMDIEMEARDTAINIFKGGGDREEVEASLHELFPDISDYLSTIIDDAEEMLEYGVR